MMPVPKKCLLEVEKVIVPEVVNIRQQFQCDSQSFGIVWQVSGPIRPARPVNTSLFCCRMQKFSSRILMDFGENKSFQNCCVHSQGCSFRCNRVKNGVIHHHVNCRDFVHQHETTVRQQMAESMAHIQCHRPVPIGLILVNPGHRD